MTLPRICYSRLRFYHFVDIEDQELGTLEDVILDVNTLEPTHLILGGGFFEEFLEDKGEIEDIDEIAPLHLIDHIENDFIVLNTKLEDLETTDKNGQLPVHGYKYSEFSKFTLQDTSGTIDAEIFDFEFNGKESQIFITHSSIENSLRAQGYYQKFELVLPVSKLNVVDSIITLNLDEQQLLDQVTNSTQPKQNGRSRVVIS